MAGAYLQAAYSNTDASSYTFSTQNLGTEASDRYIVCGSAGRKVGGSTTLSVTIGGVSATEVAESWNTTSNATLAALDIAAVPSGGTTGDVVLTFGAGCTRAAIELFRLDDLASATAHDSDVSAADPPSVALDIPDDGYATGVACTGTVTSTTWTGLTERHDAAWSGENSTLTAASDAFASAETGRTLTATFALNTASSGAFASWAFGAAGGGSVGHRIIGGGWGGRVIGMREHGATNGR